MRRRDFITLLGGAAAGWPLAAGAQLPANLPTIGVLGADPTLWGPWIAAFETRLAQLGWLNGRTVAIEYRWSEGRPQRDAEIAAEFVQSKANVIVTTGGAVAAVKQAAATIPIVFAITNDAVGGGLVKSLARPGGNVTGLSILGSDLAGKRIELLRQVAPQVRRLAVMANIGYPAPAVEMREAIQTARALRIDVAALEVRRAADIGPAFKTLSTPTDGLYVVGDPLIGANATRIITFALAGRLPTIFNTRDYVKVGGLMSYGPNFPALFVRAAELVDKILHGAKAADIPVEQPTKFDLVVNLTTAEAIGLAIPEAFLSLADEVIER
jgi:putative tryptophan/tyrosine transport system substrate-binding protein